MKKYILFTGFILFFFTACYSRTGPEVSSGEPPQAQKEHNRVEPDRVIGQLENALRKMCSGNDALTVTREGRILAVSLKGDFAFSPGSSVPGPASNRQLREIASILKSGGNIDVDVEGHTDNQGRSEFNRVLSRKRAENVKKVLVREGLDASRVFVRAYGETLPVADNSTKEGRARNRRIVIVIEPVVKR